MIPYISYELSAAICKPTSQTESQIRESNNPGLGTTYNVKRAESEPVTSRRFELRFCGRHCFSNSCRHPSSGPMALVPHNDN